MGLDAQSVRRYARIDDATDPEVVELTDAAEAYVINAIEFKDREALLENPLYCLCVKMLVSHWYDNRGTVAEKQAVPLPLGVHSLLSQLAQYSAAEVTT